VSKTATSLSVADAAGAGLSKGSLLYVNNELMRVSDAITSNTAVTVVRAVDVVLDYGVISSVASSSVLTLSTPAVVAPDAYVGFNITIYTPGAPTESAAVVAYSSARIVTLARALTTTPVAMSSTYEVSIDFYCRYRACAN
jgi:hypothetical protein